MKSQRFLLWACALCLLALPARAQINYYPATGGGTPDAHAASHESGGSDEIDVTGLTGAGGSGLTDCGANGVLVRTAEDTYACRTVTSSDGTVVISNPTGAGGDIDAVVDSAVIPVYSTGTGAAPATCTAGYEFYAKTDTDIPYYCTSTDTNTELLTPGQVSVSDLATGTDGELITWDASGDPAAVAVGTSGQVLTSNGAGAAPTFQAASGASSFDPSTTFELYEEFLSGSETIGELGNTNLNYSLISSGTVNNVGTEVVASAGNPGWAVITSSATDDSGAILAWTGEVDSFFNPTDVRDGTWNYEAVIRTDASSVANQLIYMGWANLQSVAEPSFCVGIRYDTDVDSTFVFVIADTAGGCAAASDGANTSIESSTITPAANTRYRLRIRADANGVGGNPTIYFSVNDETEKTFCSAGCDDDLATWFTGTHGSPIIKFLARAASQDLDLHTDYMYLKMTGLDRY